MNLRQIISSCAVCGGWPLQSETLLCDSCWSRIEKWMSQSQGCLTLSEKVHVQYGLAWAEGDGPLKRDFLHALKGKSCRNTWQRLAEIWARLKIDQLKEMKMDQRVWLPVPGRGLTENDDHAGRWCEALRSLFGGEISRPLERKTRDSQKQKALEERQGIEFRPKKEVPIESGAWIIADDIVTSGATVLAAHRALNAPSKTLVFALAYRIRSIKSNEVDLKP